MAWLGALGFLLLLALTPAFGQPPIIYDSLCEPPDTCSATYNVYGICPIDNSCMVIQISESVCFDCRSTNCTGCLWKYSERVMEYSGSCQEMYIFPITCVCNSNYVGGISVTVYVC